MQRNLSTYFIENIIKKNKSIYRDKKKNSNFNTQ